jgi:hypothetical protein
MFKRLASDYLTVSVRVVEWVMVPVVAVTVTVDVPEGVPWVAGQGLLPQPTEMSNTTKVMMPKIIFARLFWRAPAITAPIRPIPDMFSQLA